MPVVEPPAIEVAYDDRVILVTLGEWLADDGKIYDQSRNEAYARAIRDRLRPLVSQPFVAHLNELQAKGFAYDAPIEWALDLDARTLKPRVPLPQDCLLYTSDAADERSS